MQLHLIIDQLYQYLWPFLRVSGFMLIAPILGSAYIPAMIKILIAFVITIFIFPLVDVPVDIDPLSIPGLLIASQQLLIGITIGFIVQFVFNAIIIAGENIALTMGLGFAQLTDPVNGITIPIISQTLTIIASLYFLALNGHIALVNILINSFELMPFSAVLSMDAIHSILNWAGRMFIGAVLISIPAVTALLIVNISLGLMTRVAPQMNIFSVGFPITMMLGFIFILISIPVIMNVFHRMLNESFQFIITIL